MLALSIALLLSAAPPKPPDAKGPPPSEMAKLYFLAGDLRRAVDTARMGQKLEPAKCKALFPLLVEYQFLIPRADELTPAEAKAFLEYDRKISPGTPGKLTAQVQRKYVDAPLNSAGVARGGGDLVKARKLVAEVLAVDPQNADALKLHAELSPDAGR